MKRILFLALLACAACVDNRAPEDFWYGRAQILCQREHCPRCVGTRGVTCPNCNGTGEETCDRCHGGGDVQCGSCNGSGIQGQESCPGCEGKGTATCWSCGGDGEETCDVCDGKQKVACIETFPVDQAPAARTEDAWPPNNFQGAGADN